MPEQMIYTAQQIFTGETWLDHHAIITKSGVIQDVVPVSSIKEPTKSYHTILPAFIDLQIYGAFGKLFSVYPEAGTLSLIHKYCREGGAYWFQPTVATNTKDIIHNCIDAVRKYWENGGEGCLGLHVEGPWINKEKRGAHIESLVHPPTLEEVKELLDYGTGVITMITLAPEVCSDEVIEMIRRYGIVIAAGHSNISFEEANNSFSKGINAVTHLYNAMSSLQHRAPGLVGAAFLNNNVMASIIADGHHVDYAAIKIAKKIMADRLYLITDAVTDTGKGAYPHKKEGDKYIASGILSGSALTMMQSVKNMIEYVGVDKTEAIKMACVYPAKAGGLENKIGKIAKGFPLYFIATDEELSFVEMVW
jgi:N-acetylglucosamine-6-phosphate deacetylase